MNLKIGCIVIFFLLTFALQAQRKVLRVMFYNVENFFDTRNDSLTLDDEFTPAGTKHWTYTRYVRKILHLAEVVNAVGKDSMPAFIGLAEVENRYVLDDLIRKTSLCCGDYGIIHQDSPDARGIDVAFLYRKAVFVPLRTAFFSVSFPEDPESHTRDILYVCGTVASDTLHFMVCHFPSMSGGESQSEWKRIRAASVVRSKVDSLVSLDPKVAVIVMGDLNGKADTDAQKTLKTRPPDKSIRPDVLYNPGIYLLRKNYGSYRYKGVWQTIDHMIVSGSLLDGTHSLIAARRLSIFSAPFLLEEDKAHFGSKPFSTYRGPRYYGGYSDHLPIYLDLFIK